MSPDASTPDAVSKDEARTGPMGQRFLAATDTLAMRSHSRANMRKGPNGVALPAGRTGLESTQAPWQHECWPGCLRSRSPGRSSISVGVWYARFAGLSRWVASR